MKSKLKKLNRGVILAVVLLVGLVIYIVADNQMFKSEKPEIEQLVSDYVGEIAEINVAPEEYQVAGKAYTKEDSENRIEDYTNIIDKYWTTVDESDNLLTWYSYKAEVKNAMEYLLSSPDNGYITSCTADVTDCKINKDGPNSAVMTCTVRFIFTGTESCALIGSGGIDYSYSYNDANLDNMRKCSVEQDCKFMLQRTSDGWKIGGNEWYSYLANEMNIEAEENTEEEGSENE